MSRSSTSLIFLHRVNPFELIRVGILGVTGSNRYYFGEKYRKPEERSNFWLKWPEIEEESLMRFLYIKKWQVEDKLMDWG